MTMLYQSGYPFMVFKFFAEIVSVTDVMGSNLTAVNYDNWIIPCKCLNLFRKCISILLIYKN